MLINHLNQLSKGIRKDTTISVVFNFDFSVQSELSGEALTIAGLNDDRLVNLNVRGVEFNSELFLASKSKRISIFSLIELKRDYTHTSEVASVDSFEALGNNSLNTLEIRSLSSPISR